MKKYQYKVLNKTQLRDLVSGLGITYALDNLGEQGWELLHVETDNKTGLTEYYFKKEKK
jgi:hypothetical protein